MAYFRPRRDRNPGRNPCVISLDPLPERILLAALIDGSGRVPRHVATQNSDSSPGTGMTVYRDLVYREVAGDRQALDIYRPAGPVPIGGRPVLLAIHGGGWTKFDKREYGPKIAGLTRQGFLVIAPNYRLSRPGHPSWPTNFEGLRDAVRWIRTNAETIGADPDRIVGIGESAGGHLAELLGTYSDATPREGAVPGVTGRVDAVVSFYGPSDLATLDRASLLASRRIRTFLGGSPTQTPQRYADASPLDHVTADDAPTLLFHGRADTLVPPSQSIALARRLREAGVQSRLVLVPNAGHGFGLRDGQRNFARVIAAFVRQVLG